MPQLTRRDVLVTAGVAITPASFGLLDSYTPEERLALINAECSEWGIDPAPIVYVAWCESTMGQHPSTYRYDRTYRGVFQFNQITWREQAPLFGVPEDWDAALDDYWNIKLAVALIASGQGWRWACYR